MKALKIISLRNCEELFNYKQQLPSHSSCVIKHNKLELKKEVDSIFFLGGGQYNRKSLIAL